MSNSMEGRWIDEQEKIFSGDLKLSIKDFECPCVFRVPRPLADTKPEAYTPQLLGLGPFHHQRLDLYPMQRKKLDAVVQFLSPNRMLKLKEVICTLENEHEYQIRACYYDHLDATPKALALIIAVDSVFLTHFLLSNANENDRDPSLENETTQLAADVLMLENQIPTTFMMQTLKELNLEPPNMAELVFAFFQRVSPLELKKTVKIGEVLLRMKGHLLSMMYHTILDEAQQGSSDLSDQNLVPDNKTGTDVITITQGSGGSSKTKEEEEGKPPAGGKLSGDEPATGLSQMDIALNLFNKIWFKTTAMFKSVNPDYEANRGVEEIRIPSVSQLEIFAGIKIAALASPGRIKEIKFDEKEKKLLLPRLTFNSNTEAILRNLCAYEEAQNKSGLMGEYADLMCGIVDTADDVRRLREAKVITSKLENKEIAAAFCGKMRSSSKEEMKSNVGEAIVGVNRVYDRSKRVRMWRIIWKVVGKMRNCIIFLVILGVVCSLLMSTVCQFHDCQKF